MPANVADPDDSDRRIHMQPTNARIALRLSVGLALILMVVLPVSAYAATFTHEYPVGVLHTPPQAVGVTVFGSTAFDVRTVKMSIGSVVYKATTSTTSSGHWVLTETGPDANGAYKGTWSWVADAKQPNQVVMYGYPSGAALADGNSLVTFSIKDVKGVTSTDTWTYVLRVPPVIGTLTPASGSLVTTLTPVISAPVSDNGTGAISATATVNGTAADASVSGGVVRVVSPVLPNDATSTVVVTARDAAGNAMTKRWSFFVETYPDMFSTLGQCASCHPGFETDNDMGPNCLICHGGLNAPHKGTPVSLHMKADVSSCSPCHVSDLTVEHGRHIGSGGVSISCLSCHASTDPLVRAAIAAGTSACTACHSDVSHAAIHDTTMSPSCAGAACHSGTSLAAIHINSGTSLTCDTCHSSANSNVIAAIAGHNKSCTACHDASNPHGDLSAAHQATPASATITISGVSFGTLACSECHAPTNLLNVHGSACATCHPTVAATAKPWAKGCVQGGCHGASSSAPKHGSIDAAHVFPADKSECLAYGCHDTAGITPFVGKSVGQLHAYASTSTPGGTRTSCQICHAPGVIPTTDCATCHSDRLLPHGYDAAIHTGTPLATTFTISGATYPALACASCHSTELGVEHVKTTSTGNIGCSECHPGRAAQLPPPWDKNTCAQGNCHAGTSPEPTHGDIDAAHARLTNAADDACVASGCHTDGNLAAIHASVTATVNGQSRSSCMLCHASGVPASRDCTSCHPDKVASHYDAATHTGTPANAAMTILGSSYGNHGCSECHGTLELGVIHTTGCSTCHPASANSTKPWNKSCATGGCHTAGSTKPMHASIDAVHVRPALPAAADACFVAGCHTGGTSLAAIHAAQGCTPCHAAAKTPTANCSATGCHDLANPHRDLTTAHASSGGTDFVTVGMGNGDHFIWDGVVAQCSQCHESNLIAQHASNCDLCHGATARLAVKQAVTAHNTDCTACHAGQHGSSFNYDHFAISDQGCDCHNENPYSGDSSNVTCEPCH